ncbi:TolB-like protein/class 3 adenylate cyclase [Phyllobacterium trifolii]|uniref:TolB-like protein/class 3 adenylate cyclase n=1 Tax=Phyllobacterium trifolii TaxID=300193 RepID=A0A839U879_9HYPH|nr:tetratricopeptide repeat protein [Phyllobacterium trifolii]MBB3147326.1 TolB-like protein/class 3 adenylate cyclase [Phyllobacterium trifolii]
MERRLVTIMAADVVGYSARMELSESETIRQLSALTRMLGEQVGRYSDRVFSRAGDGFLSEFSSPVMAVQSGFQIQRILGSSGKEGGIQLRIGIHLADAVVDGKDLLGDGVNIAARVEGLAEPGSVLITQTVFDHVKRMATLQFEDLGERPLKNISEPIRLYRVVGELEDHGTRDVQAFTDGISNVNSGPPIIAVLPFENLGSDKRWVRLANGLSADIIVDLARYPDLAVVARQTMLAFKGQRDDLRSIGRELNADYLLEGSLQATRNQVRISVQLVDARSGADLWAARYEKPIGDLFAIQDSVTENVVNVLASCCGKLAHLRWDAARRKPPASLGAYDYYLLGVEQLNMYSPGSNAEAIRLLSNAVALDPALATAWSALGFAYAVQGGNAYDDDPTVSLERYRFCAEKALTLDPADNITRQCVGDLRACKGDFDGAINENTRALAAAPNDGDLLALVAGSRALAAGNPDEGYLLIHRALNINALAPSWYFSMLGRVTFVTGRYQECIAAARRAPEMPSTLMFLAMSHAMLDEMDEAATLGDKLAREYPGFTTEKFVAGYPVTNPPAIAAIRQGAQRAGLA